MGDSDQSLRAILRALPSLKGPFHDIGWNAPPATPQEAFQIWLNDAIAEGIKEPHAMTLSTVDEEGHPDARVLILKNVDERGWHFAVKDDSPKGQQIATNSHVALTFYWPQLGRQVRIRGKAVALSDVECAEDFKARPIGSKTSAVASKQSGVLNSPEELHDSLAQAQALLTSHPDYVVPGWAVYAVLPDNVEFWQGATDRLHKRLRYVRTVDEHGWFKQDLWP